MTPYKKFTVFLECTEDPAEGEYIYHVEAACVRDAEIAAQKVHHQHKAKVRAVFKGWLKDIKTGSGEWFINTWEKR